MLGDDAFALKTCLIKSYEKRTPAKEERIANCIMSFKLSMGYDYLREGCCPRILIGRLRPSHGGGSLDFVPVPESVRGRVN